VIGDLIGDIGFVEGRPIPIGETPSLADIRSRSHLAFRHILRSSNNIRSNDGRAAAGSRPRRLIDMRTMLARIALCQLWLVGAALGAEPPSPSLLPRAELFAPGIISAGANDGAPTFSPDGKTLFFERTNGQWATILSSKWTGRSWSRPVLAQFSGEYSDQQPALSPDGSYLVFVSSRPRNDTCTGCATRTSHLYRVDRTARGWGPVQELPKEVNMANRIFKPSIAANGDLFFMADVGAGGPSKWRLFRSVFEGGRYAPAEPLPFSGADDGDVDPYVAPDESFIVFSSNHRAQHADGHEHLFIVHRAAGTWSAPQAIHYEGEGDFDDGEASVSPDRKWLYFTSARIVGGAMRRDRGAALAELSRMDSWDNSNNNVWRIPVTF
jgi:hypothetical protein